MVVEKVRRVHLRGYMKADLAPRNQLISQELQQQGLGGVYLAPVLAGTGDTLSQLCLKTRFPLLYGPSCEMDLVTSMPDPF